MKLKGYRKLLGYLATLVTAALIVPGEQAGGYLVAAFGLFVGGNVGEHVGGHLKPAPPTPPTEADS